MPAEIDNTTVSAVQTSTVTDVRNAAAREIRIAEFDGIRGIAIALVFLFHLKPQETSPLHGSVWDQICSPMWCGVDLFFVLSGFLITGILADTRNEARYFVNFYARRTVRIFPLYFGVLVGLFALLPLAGRVPGSPLKSVVNGEYYQQLWSQQGWLWTYLQNFLQAKGEHQLPGLGHFWSLAIEEQFYLVWPLLVYYLSPRRMLWVSLGIFALGCPLRAWMLQNGWDAWAVRHLTHARIDSLAAGGCVALMLRLFAPGQLRRVAYAALGVAVIAMIWLWISVPGISRKADSVTTWGYSAFALFFASFILITALGNLPKTVVWILRSRVLIIAGTLSYGIYVFHWPIVHGVRAVVGKIGSAIPSISAVPRYLLVVLLTTIITILIAQLSWKYFEKPFLSLKRYFRYHVS